MEKCRRDFKGDKRTMSQPQSQQRPVDKELEKKKKEQAQDRRNG